MGGCEDVSMIDLLIKTVAGIFSGILGALGLGGGGVLLMYLSLFTNTAHLTAQGINLLFFLPNGLLAIYRHNKEGLIEKKTVKRYIIWGVVGAIIGFVIAGFIGSTLLRKIFGCFLIYIGISAFFQKKKTK